MSFNRIGVKACRAMSLLVAMSLIALAGGCARPTSLTVPMTLGALDKTPKVRLSGQSLRIYLAPVQDNRAMTDRIGENQEKTPAVPILAGGPSPAVWLHDALTQQFQISGVNVVPDSGSADRTVSLVLTEFWDGEDPDYDARILCTLKITDKTGSVLYSAPVSGHYDERGHSLSIDDYQDCMSNAVVDLAATLLADPKIIAVLTAH